MWFLRRRSNKHEEAEGALKDAEANLEQVKRRGHEVSRVAEALRDFRERNHLGEQIEQIIIRGKG